MHNALTVQLYQMNVLQTRHPATRSVNANIPPTICVRMRTYCAFVFTTQAYTDIAFARHTSRENSTHRYCISAQPRQRAHEHRVTA